MYPGGKGECFLEGGRGQEGWALHSSLESLLHSFFIKIHSFLHSFISVHSFIYLLVYSYIFVGSLTPIFVLLPPASWKFLLGIYYVLRVVLRVLGQRALLPQPALLPPMVTDPSAITQSKGRVLVVDVRPCLLGDIGHQRSV